MFHHHIKLMCLSAAFLGFAFANVAISLPALAVDKSNSIQIKEASMTKSLTPVIEVDETTKVYSDTAGLDPKPQIAEIRKATSPQSEDAQHNQTPDIERTK